MITTIKISGMHCASCKTLIEEVCNEVKGVLGCDVDLDRGIVVIEHDGADALTKAAEEIQKLGDYKIEII